MHIHLKDSFNFVSFFCGINFTSNFVSFFCGINFTSNFLFQKVHSVLALKKTVIIVINGAIWHQNGVTSQFIKVREHNNVRKLLFSLMLKKGSGI